mmetsp:Transcript_75020/g.208565  ORF Transcript_75020/g.208565 Transcript_75020/m.208565 type:complete len:297 (+) Transcript_75020:435-1325(+)
MTACNGTSRTSLRRPNPACGSPSTTAVVAYPPRSASPPRPGTPGSRQTSRQPRSPETTFARPCSDPLMVSTASWCRRGNTSAAALSSSSRRGHLHLSRLSRQRRPWSAGSSSGNPNRSASFPTFLCRGFRITSPASAHRRKARPRKFHRRSQQRLPAHRHNSSCNPRVAFRPRPLLQHSGRGPLLAQRGPHPLPRHRDRSPPPTWWHPNQPPRRRGHVGRTPFKAFASRVPWERCGLNLRPVRRQQIQCRLRTRSPHLALEIRARRARGGHSPHQMGRPRAQRLLRGGTSHPALGL